MATRALITYFDKEENKYHTIYQHWDGYPEELGEKLVKFYSDESKIRDMIALGHASCIQEKLDPVPEELREIPISSMTDEQMAVWYSHSQFYERDRGEEDQRAIKSHSFVQAQQIDRGQEYHYLYRDGKWQVFDSNGDNVSSRLPL